MTINDTPVFVPTFNSSSSWGVAENAATGTDLGSLGATDPDGGALSYTVSGGPFAVASSGDLVTTGPLNAETWPKYFLTIVATTPRAWRARNN